MQFDHFLAWALTKYGHVTQAENLSFPYLKSYCPLNFSKVTKVRGSAASLTEVISHEVMSLISEGGKNLPPPPPPPPPMWNMVKKQTNNIKDSVKAKIVS